MIKSDFTKGWMWGKAGQEKVETTLPHDAMQYEKRRADAEGSGAGAYYEGGCYEYEKTFTVPADWNDKHTLLHFEGVYCNSKVYVNGQEAGGCAYGYSPFWVELDPYLCYGAENTIVVVVKNDQLPNSRWYSGSGIYRPVWLWQGEKSYIKPEGVQVRTTNTHPAQVSVSIDAIGSCEKMQVRILDGDTVIAEAVGNASVIDLPGATLWSENDPHLYQCEVTLWNKGKALDQAVTTFGIRRITWNNQGLFVNGVSTLLRGGCVHHDNGVIGARSYGESEWRRVEL